MSIEFTRIVDEEASISVTCEFYSMQGGRLLSVQRDGHEPESLWATCQPELDGIGHVFLGPRLPEAGGELLQGPDVLTKEDNLTVVNDVDAPPFKLAHENEDGKPEIVIVRYLGNVSVPNVAEQKKIIMSYEGLPRDFLF